MKADKMPRSRIPRQESLMEPEVVNPFVHKLELTWLDKLQIVLMSFTLVPIRILLIFTSLVTAYLLARIALIGRPKEEEKKPMDGWRKLFMYPMVYLGRFCYFMTGFQNIQRKGVMATAQEAPVVVAAPHSSFLDAFVVFYVLGIPSFVQRIENLKIPLIGTLTKFTQPVFVSREDPNSRINTIKEITDRALSGGAWPQIIIFPEGTCTNRSCLISFKPGAFYPGVPVQPIIFRYGNKLDTYTWTWESNLSAFKVLWYSLSQFHNRLEIEYLPVYKPSEAEKNDAKLYARNVRAVMAKALQVPVTDHTYEDIRLMNYAAKLHLPAASGLVEFAKINRKLGMNFDSMKAQLDRFCEVAQSRSGQVGIEDFAAHLNMPVSDALREMFSLYDRDQSGTIDFREYVIGLSLVAMPANSEETVQLAFRLFDSGDKGYITPTEFAGVLDKAFGMEFENARQIFQHVDKDQDDKITYDEFKAYAELRPEYAGLFSAFNKLQSLKEETSSHEEPANNGVVNRNSSANGAVKRMGHVTSGLEPELRDPARVKSA